MNDKPIVGSFSNDPDESPKADGVVLYDPTPREGLELPEDRLEEGASKTRAWLLGLTVVVVVAATSVAVVVRPGQTESEVAPAMPELVPARIDAARASLRPFPRAELSGTVGSMIRLGVRASGLGGVPMADTLVRFAVESGSGALFATEATADSSGVAVTTLALPTLPGTTVVVATLEASDLQPMRLTVRALPGAPTSIMAISGGGQGGQVGELLQDRMVVRVADELDNPVPGAPMRFAIRTGEGLVAPSEARTDSLGQASAMWRLGVTEGEQQLVATTPLLVGSEVVFRATATPRPLTQRPGDRTTGIETGPVTIRATTFVIGGGHVCRIRAGVASCRGSNTRGEPFSDLTRTFVSLASGIGHLCGLDRDGTAYCWGANDGGQLGDGTRTERPSPMPVRTELRFSMLTAGANHTCGLAGGGVPVCWGANLSGQLGDGSRTDQRGPRTVGGGLEFRTLTAGWDHTCGLTANGNAFCWGANNQGQLGDGSRLDRLQPTLVRGAVESLVAGSAHTCGISERRTLCWGANRFGQLGDGTTEDRPEPSAVLGLPSVPTALTAGAVHTCALLAGGEAYCWGQNLQGQVGDGSNENRLSATRVSGDLTFTALYAGGAVTCGITTSGAEYCWGMNQSGQLGDGTRVSRAAPTLVQSR